MRRRNETECEDTAWLNSPEKAEIDRLLREIEKEETQQRKAKKKNGKTALSTYRK